MKTGHLSLFLILIAVLFVNGCSAPAPAPTGTALVQPGAAVQPSATAVTFTATAIPSTATNTRVPSTKVFTPTNTATPAPTQTATTTETNTAVPPTTTATNTLLPPTRTVVTTRILQIPSAASVPILYMDQVDGNTRVVTKAVDLNGTDSGIVVDSFGAVWAPDGKSFGYVNLDGTELYQQTPQGEPKTLLRAKPEERFRRVLAWSPDGTRIALITRIPNGTGGKDVVVAENGREVGRYPLPVLGADTLWLPNKFRWSPDGKKILLSWDYTIVIHTDTNGVESISNQRVMAEWAPTSDAVYYFDLVPGNQEISGVSYGDLGNFNLKKLGDPAPTVLMKQEQVSALGLHNNISAFTLRADDLQYNRGLLNLSPGGSRLVLVTGLDSGSRFSFYTMAPEGTVALDKPEKTIEVDSSTGSVEWAPDETQLAVVAVGGKEGPAIKVLDFKTMQWKKLAPLAFQMPSYHFDEQLNLLLTLSSKTLSWAQ